MTDNRRSDSRSKNDSWQKNTRDDRDSHEKRFNLSSPKKEERGGERRDRSIEDRHRGGDRHERFRDERRSPRYHKKSSRENSAENKDENCIYVTNLGPRTREEELEGIFKKFGEIKEIRVIKHPHTGECRGFAFITFENNGQAKDAINSLNGADFEGKKMALEVSKRSKGRSSTPGIYLGPSSAKRPRYPTSGGMRPRFRSRSDSRRRNYTRHEDRGRRGDYREYRPRGEFNREREYRDNREIKDTRDSRDYRGNPKEYSRHRSSPRRSRSRSHDNRRKY